MVEWTIESQKSYADPFNDVELDVIFTKDSKSWRVPTFWRGGQKWTVRFAPPSPGEYTYRLQSTDPSNPDLNGHEGRVTIAPYTGTNELLRHGMLRVSANKRYFEHVDGTPFYWLGDTWWTGLSDRLSWEGFQKLTGDRKAKGFTVVQIVGGLIPSNEERAPVDAGFRNEGGAVWDREFKRINPKYFDFADRRIQHLIDAGMAPAIVGGWNEELVLMGVPKMKQHWRYLIARYGAYPVFWIVGGEVKDPPPQMVGRFPEALRQYIAPGWTEVARYVRATDPYRHPLSAHESPPPADVALQDVSLTDFDMLQPGHFGWASIATEVAQLTSRSARTTLIKPMVQAEIGYEQHHAEHFQDFQRVAFWLAMLNGAAGHTYGTIETAEAYTADKPLHRTRWSLFTWEEAMSFPGSAQVGLSAKLLRQYPWYRLTPHPEWVTPRGTTLLEPNDGNVWVDILGPFLSAWKMDSPLLENEAPAGEWKQRQGTFRQPFAAGIPGEVRIVYIPYFGLSSQSPPTIQGLEPQVRYRAYYWDPVLGIKVDLGLVQRPQPAPVIFNDAVPSRTASAWVRQTGTAGQSLWLVKGVKETNLVSTVGTTADADTALILRYQDTGNYVAAVYSPAEKAIFLRQCVDGQDKAPLGQTAALVFGADVRLTAELRDAFGIVSIADGRNTFTSPVVSFVSLFDPPAATTKAVAGGVGVIHHGESADTFGSFEIRKSPTLAEDERLGRKLYDANGVYRGEMSGTPEWDDYGKKKLILLDAYRPERFPFNQDWVLVLDAEKGDQRLQ